MQDSAALSVTLVDGYVDEPAHFGVPPYVSTYPRYVAGALVDAGVPADGVTYHTIDGLRDNRSGWHDIEAADLLIYVGGMTVAGKYAGGTPAEPDEVGEPAREPPNPACPARADRETGDDGVGGRGRKRLTNDVPGSSGWRDASGRSPPSPSASTASTT